MSVVQIDEDIVSIHDLLTSRPFGLVATLTRMNCGYSEYMRNPLTAVENGAVQVLVHRCINLAAASCMSC